MNKIEFLEKAREKHGYKYSYDTLPDKLTLLDKVDIFYEGKKYRQTVSKHLLGRCPERGFNKKETIDFIKKSISVWGDRYDYTMVEYNGALDYVKILCDGFVYEQRASSHLNGISPDFRKSVEHQKMIFEDEIGNKDIKEFLEKYEFNYNYRYRFGSLLFGFYLPSIRCVIEYQGQSHFNLDNIIEYDKIKMNYCEDNYINLIRIKYDQVNIIWEILWENLKLFISDDKANRIV